MIESVKNLTPTSHGGRINVQVIGDILKEIFDDWAETPICWSVSDDTFRLIRSDDTRHFNGNIWHRYDRTKQSTLFDISADVVAWLTMGRPPGRVESPHGRIIIDPRPTGWSARHVTQDGKHGMVTITRVTADI